MVDLTKEQRPSSSEQPSQKFLGIISIKHDRGLAFAYGASLGGWTFLVIDTIPFNEPWRSLLSLVAGILVAGITIWEFRSLDKRRNWADQATRDGKALKRARRLPHF